MDYNFVNDLGIMALIVMPYYLTHVVAKTATFEQAIRVDELRNGTEDISYWILHKFGGLLN